MPIKFVTAVHTRVAPCLLAIWFAAATVSEPVLVAQTAAGAQAVGRSRESTAAVRGRALSASDEPLPGQTVRIRNVQANTVLGSTTTDAAGNFRFSVAHPGSYIVELVNSGGAVLATSSLVTLEDQTAVVADVRLSNDKPPAGVIASHKVPRALLIALAAAGSGLIAAAVVGQDSTPVR